MLVRFEVSHYKNFQEPVVIDFGEVGGYQFNGDCIAQDAVSKMLIYGKNGTGKTNLGQAVTDIAACCGAGGSFGAALPGGAGAMAFPGGVCSGYGAALRGSASAASGSEPCGSLSSQAEPAKFDYLFRFDGVDVQYTYCKNAGEYANNGARGESDSGVFRTEALYVDGAKIFDFDYGNKWYWHGNLELIGAETVDVERFLECAVGCGAEDDERGDDSETADVGGADIPFLRWLFSNAVFPKDAVMAKLRKFVDGMGFVDVPVQIWKRRFGYSGGNCPGAQEEERRQAFFSAMGLEYAPAGGSLSDGELALLGLYEGIAANKKSQSFLYLDGFDSFLHHEAAEKVFVYLKEKYPDCQIVLTTQNTHLMTNRLTRPDCVCVLRPDGKLLPLNKAAGRELREGHNLEKLYMSGEFEG